MIVKNIFQVLADIPHSLLCTKKQLIKKTAAEYSRVVGNYRIYVGKVVIKLAVKPKSKVITRLQGSSLQLYGLQHSGERTAHKN